MILLLGNKGGMGRRYSAVLDYLEIPFCGVDVDNAVPGYDYDGVIIATPTDTHFDLVRIYSQLKIPILCEKAITRNEDELGAILDIPDLQLQMVNQYSQIAYGSGNGETFYDYYNTGKDGLAWDCINIIGLAKGLAKISNQSPIWKCTINGQELKITDMDRAYIRMIADWYKTPRSNLKYIERAHRKIFDGEYEHV